MIPRIIGQEEACVLPTLEQMVNALSQGDYQQIVRLADDMGAYSAQLLQQVTEEITEQAGKIDVFGTPCSFSPNYQYRQLTFYHWNDGSGMSCEYDLTSGGQLNDWTLQLRFVYAGQQMKVVFDDLHIL